MKLCFPIALIASLTSFLGANAPEQVTSQRDVLKGIGEVCVVVSDIKLEDSRNLLTSAMVKTSVELQLRKSKIEVVDLPYPKRTPPILGVVVCIRKMNVNAYLYQVKCELTEGVHLVREKPLLAPATTWSTVGVLGTVPTADVSPIRQAIADQIDEFCNEYLAANSSKSP